MKKKISIILILAMFISISFSNVYGALNGDEYAEYIELDNRVYDPDNSDFTSVLSSEEKERYYYLIDEKNNKSSTESEEEYAESEKIFKSKTAEDIAKMSDDVFNAWTSYFIQFNNEGHTGANALPAIFDEKGTDVVLYRYTKGYYETANKNIETANKNNPNKNTTSSDDFWGQASSWWGNSQPKEGDKNAFKIPEQAQKIIDMFSDMINVVGTTLIIIATIVLGIKFIFGSVENQTSAKEGLITLLVACIFFFGWQGIYGLLVDSGSQQLVFTVNTGSYKEAIGNVLYVVSFVAKCLLVIGVIYVGIKYIFAGAAGRAQLKGKSVYFFIGIILAFATTNVLTFISKIINEVV